jgi:hypothetical protein
MTTPRRSYSRQSRPKQALPEQEDGSVGYCKPPRHSQFAAGRSGNPKGRPKSARNLKTILEEILRTPMKIKKGDKVLRVSALEALALGDLTGALKGDPKAHANLMQLMKLSGVGAEEEQTQAEQFDVDQYQSILQDYVARMKTE